MAKVIKSDKLDEWIASMKKLGAEADSLAGKIIYEMAAEVADNVRKNAESLRAITDEEAIINYKKGRSTTISESQKKGLINSLGISPSKNDSGIRTISVGFDGYNSVKTKAWPQGQPNAMIARSLEKGTSFMPKQPFLQKALRASRKRINERVDLVIKEEIEAFGVK